MVTINIFSGIFTLFLLPLCNTVRSACRYAFMHHLTFVYDKIIITGNIPEEKTN